MCVLWRYRVYCTVRGGAVLVDILKYCTAGFLPGDRYRHAERLSKRVEMKGGEQRKAGWACMNNRQSIMDDKLTKFFLFSVPSLCSFPTLSSSLCAPHSDTMSLLWGTCSGRRRRLPCSPEPLSCLWKGAALLSGLLKSLEDILYALSLSTVLLGREKCPIRGGGTRAGGGGLE